MYKSASIRVLSAIFGLLDPIAVVGKPVIKVTTEVNIENNPPNKQAPETIPPRNTCVLAAAREQEPLKPIMAKIWFFR